MPFHPDNWSESQDDCQLPDSRDTKPASEPCCRPPRLASSQQESCRRGRNQTLCCLLFLFCLFRDTGICSSHSAAAGTPLCSLSTLPRAPPPPRCLGTRFLDGTPLEVARQEKNGLAALLHLDHGVLRGVRFRNGARAVTDNRKGKKKKDADDVRCCEVSSPVVVIVCPPVFSSCLLGSFHCLPSPPFASH